MPLDPQARELLLNTVGWEQFVEGDVYGDETWLEAIDISCHIDDNGAVNRTPGEVVFVPEVTAYFDAADPNVGEFTFRDRFHIHGIGAPTARVQPRRINPVYGPAGDPWFVEVTLGGSGGSA